MAVTQAVRHSMRPHATSRRPAPRRPLSVRPAVPRFAGAAGLAYVLGVSIENMELLRAPSLGSAAADVRAFYGDHALAVVTTAAGAVALVAYALFAVALYGLLRNRERPGGIWSVAALVGGVAGPAVAAAGMVATAILAADGGQGLSDDLVRTLYDFHLRAQMVAGVFAALFLGATGVAALRSGALPRPLAAAACAIALPLSVAPLAAVMADRSLEVAVTIAFALQTLWAFLASLWLALADRQAAGVFIRRAAFLVLVLAAGLVGIALVAVPGATVKFFAWGLGPEPLAAFAGGVYVGSAVVYAVALRRPGGRVRGLVAGAMLLSVSVFVITLGHLDQFDLDRLQAWAWIVLFAGFSVIMVGLLAFGREPEGHSAGALAPWARGLLGLAGALLGALTVALWVDPALVGDASPFDLSPLGGRFAGSWVGLLAGLAAWAAARDRAGDAQLSALALVALPAGALVAALRTLSQLDSSAAVAYLAAIAVLIAAGVAVLASLRRAGA